MTQAMDDLGEALVGGFRGLEIKPDASVEEWSKRTLWCVMEPSGAPESSGTLQSRLAKGTDFISFVRKEVTLGQGPLLVPLS